MTAWRSALEGHIAPGEGTPGPSPVCIGEIRKRRIVQLAGWPESFAGVTARLAERTGWVIPECPDRAGGASGAGGTASRAAVFRVGAERLWIALSGVSGTGAASVGAAVETADGPVVDAAADEVAAAAVEAALEEACAGSRAVRLEIGPGLTVFGISGAAAETMLQKGTPVDLHLRAFPAGAVARTSRRGIGRLVHRRGDEAFEVYVYRSHAAAFWRRLRAAALESGYAVGDDGGG